MYTKGTKTRDIRGAQLCFGMAITSDGPPSDERWRGGRRHTDERHVLVHAVNNFGGTRSALCYFAHSG